MNVSNDKYIADILHAYRLGVSINAISKAVGLSWLEVRKIVKITAYLAGQIERECYVAID